MDAQNWEIVLDVLVERIARLTDDYIKQQAISKSLQDDLDRASDEISKMLREDE